ncbi:MAG: peptidase M14 [Winogradskyella sp.]|uniref:M14 family zinc carboxypeptidase n=1 Tax=Winogradskyella sp. TaxID=1883156 RepID=UPI0017D2D6D1|nr:M14 family zinc carboxypeptidase [Winogradskyella sp.]MBT8245565.1 peptidase M14 [Winogradskyella sp.]NNK22578.1 peptidase M14 [Winogradskyella sp.]
MTSKYLSELQKSFKEKSLFGRYITNSKIADVLKKLSTKFEVSTLGYSVENRPIYSIKIGRGTTKVLLWSQMHGNESTTTKAIFDLCNAFMKGEFSDIIESCTLQIIPILNPDGAERYTRINANDVDLNRDAQDLSQPESKVLRVCFDDFEPDYCFNLHGQRTIFGAGDAGNSAILSFLSPSEDDKRSITITRKKAMAVISSINKNLQPDLADAIGRYDDGFNLNCVGDTFQSMGVPTILYEAGHYPNDYEREITRVYLFKALFYGLQAISNSSNYKDFNGYYDIPENKKNFYDVIIRNCRSKDSETSFDVAIQFKEVLKDGGISFVPYVEKLEQLDSYFGHDEIDAKNAMILNHENKILKVGYEIVFAMLNNRKYLIKS